MGYRLEGGIHRGSAITHAGARARSLALTHTHTHTHTYAHTHVRTHIHTNRGLESAPTRSSAAGMIGGEKRRVAITAFFRFRP